MNLLPMIQPETVETETELPMYREVKWDFEKNCPIYKNGEPVIVEGKDAVLVWAWNALHTERFRYEIYTWNYGNETESLVGQNFSEELKQSESARYVKECLLINPYITDVKNIVVNFDNEQLSINGTLDTVYGEVNINV